jgi:hypothetical protein
MTSDEWATANLAAAERAVVGASEALYGLLGGQVDPEWEREQLEAQVARLRLTMTESPGHVPSSEG